MGKQLQRSAVVDGNSGTRKAVAKPFRLRFQLIERWNYPRWSHHSPHPVVSGKPNGARIAIRPHVTETAAQISGETSPKPVLASGGRLGPGGRLAVSWHLSIE